MKELVISTLGFLVVVSFGSQWFASHTKSQLTSSTNPDFKRFQRIFFAPYLLALFSDWLQGPYVYRLYSSYGFEPAQIALLYIVGFGASVLFGTCTGPLADRFGRKRLCLIFTILYTFCCVTKISPNFWWLFTGRLFGGISTSILFSTFEAWYVCQHNEQYAFPSEWISATFSISTFWNGVLAIGAGLVSDIGAEWLNFGPVAPFMTAIPCLIISGFLISWNWTENFGSRQNSLGRTCLQGLRVIFQEPTILLLGIVQSMFESVMYIFVFLWTPILDSAGGNWPLWLVFSCFMVCIMIGSSVNSLLLNQNIRPSNILFVAICAALVSMATCSWSTGVTHRSPVLSFVAFLILEIAVGMYFPAIGYLRSQVIPESLRANIMNWFRVPLNLITCFVLYWLHRDDGKPNSSNQTSNSQDYLVNAFIFNCLMCSIGLLASLAFSKRFVEKSHDAEAADDGKIEK